ncbi:MAG: LPS-assembly protein LptD [Rhizobiaceae bacterium]|nr:LPS-assembly protein LptD [Rhizobiaceae bacterium]
MVEKPNCADLMPVKDAAKRLLATVSVAGLFAFMPQLPIATILAGAPSAQAQVLETGLFGDGEAVSEEEQLLLESDDLTFDTDRNLVIATGNVQIAYGRTTLVADRVEYNQQSGRVTAFGNVEILEPNGNRIFANEIDVTDNFSDGFISALNVQTADNTRIAAESADRRDGTVTQFNNGVYTACEQCKENPDKPPFWQIRAKKVTIDDNKRTIEYEDATFEFFGKPVARLSRFSHADPAIKRKSGFLTPDFGGSDELGFAYKQGYFFNLAPNYDLTLTGAYYAEQGFLGEAEWRHRTENGEYNIRYAGIDQQRPENFLRDISGAATVDSEEDDRHAVTTQGLFDINDRWKLGWHALFQSDENFARTYELNGFAGRDITNQIFLTGIGEKNYFDLRAQDFLVQDDIIDQLGNEFLFPGDQSATDQQATILPLLDYNAVTGEEFNEGQISFDLNITSLDRGAPQISNFDRVAGAPAANERFTGLEGRTTRASAFLEWKGSSISDGGLVSTLALNVQGDAIRQDINNNLNGAPLVSNPDQSPLFEDESLYRVMPAASLEIRYPLIAQSANASHIFEPIAQIIVRPDEEEIGQFANEDAQSLIFDASNLFRQNKFSGYDRVEGGTRANIGFRYSASFNTGGSIDIVAGQSFHLDGENSFAATNDLVNVGQESGLETDRSDYVASIQLDNGEGVSIGAGVRLDEEDLGLNRAEVSTRVINTDYTFIGSYTFTEAQPNYLNTLPFDPNADQTPRDRHEVSGSASLRLDENWRAFGSARYDIVDNEFSSFGGGLAYSDDCFSFSVGYTNLNPDFTGAANEHRFNFAIGLRTVGGFNRSFDFGGDEE